MVGAWARLLGLDRTPAAEGAGLAAQHACGAGSRFRRDPVLISKGMLLTPTPAFLATVGYSPDEIPAAITTCSWILPRQPARFMQFFLAEPARRQGAWGEFRRRARDGREVWIQASYNPMFDHTGKKIGFINFATEITAHVAQPRRPECGAAAGEHGCCNRWRMRFSRTSEQATQWASAAGRGIANVNAVAQGSAELASSVTRSMPRSGGR